MHILAGLTGYDKYMLSVYFGFIPLVIAVFIVAVILLVISLNRKQAYAVQGFFITLFLLAVSTIMIFYGSNLAYESTYHSGTNYCIPSEKVTCQSRTAGHYKRAEALQSISFFVAVGALGFSVFWYQKQKQAIASTTESFPAKK